MNKKNKKSSPNRIKCNVSGQERMSNATYIANKAAKAGVDSDTWKDFYVNKQSYKEIVDEVASVGFDAAARTFQVDKGTLQKYLRYNGRGGFVKIANKIEARAKETKETLAAAA